MALGQSEGGIGVKLALAPMQFMEQFRARRARCDPRVEMPSKVRVPGIASEASALQYLVESALSFTVRAPDPAWSES